MACFKKQSSHGRISLKICMVSQFGNGIYPHSIEIRAIKLSAQVEREVISTLYQKRPGSARAAKVSDFFPFLLLNQGVWS